jgi:undecaprenyl-diphosphatase
VPIVHIIVLAAVQGITEFLPISSSGHLILVPNLLGWQDQGRMIDVAVHIGTLLAVMLYFWRDIGGMIGAFFRAFRQVGSHRPLDRQFWLQVNLIVATIPAVIAGVVIDRYFAEALRHIEVVAFTTIVFALLLYFADRIFMTIRKVEHITVWGALFAGVFQALALIPGTSRSGITMTACRMMGVERPEAARFSFLMAVPAILGAGALEGWKLWQSGDTSMAGDAVVTGAFAFVFGLAAIAFMMAWLRRASFTPFVLYRLALGAGLLYYIYGWPL